MVPARVATAVRQAPALHLEALPAVAVAAVTFAASATPAEQAALWSLVTIAGGLASGLLKRPAHIALTSAMVTTVAANLAVLGLHLPHGASSAAFGVAALVPLLRGLVAGQAAVPAPAAADPAQPRPQSPVSFPAS